MVRVLVTGANGFVGQALIRHLLTKGFYVRAAFRTAEALQRSNLAAISSSAFEPVVVGDIDVNPDWSAALQNIDVIVHLAARVHVMREHVADPLLAFRQANVVATQHLATAAVNLGIKRFIFLSSIHVNGQSTLTNTRGFTETDLPQPHGAYAQSKWEAEQWLTEYSQNTGLETVIIRPSLVYGQGVKGNFASMLNIIKRGIPLPLASVQNRRSFIYIENLCDAISVCISHPRAASQTYVVSDNEIVSTPELIRLMANALGKIPKLWPFPSRLIYFLGKITGQTSTVERLLGSLVVDNSKIKQSLHWMPPYTLKQGIQRDFLRK